jgi:hypothetical protein
MLRFQIEQAKGFKRGSFATGVVFGRGGRDLEFLRSRLVAYGVARLAPSGDRIKDDFYRGRSFRPPPAPAPNPNADIDTTAAL